MPAYSFTKGLGGKVSHSNHLFPIRHFQRLKLGFPNKYWSYLCQAHFVFVYKRILGTTTLCGQSSPSSPQIFQSKHCQRHNEPRNWLRDLEHHFWYTMASLIYQWGSMQGQNITNPAGPCHREMNIENAMRCSVQRQSNEPSVKIWQFTLWTSQLLMAICWNVFVNFCVRPEPTQPDVLCGN